MAKRTKSRTAAERQLTRRMSDADLKTAIRLTLEIPTPVTQTNGRVLPNIGKELARLTPTQRERTLTAIAHGSQTRLVIAFPKSETRDLDEAIRALPADLQGFVTVAEKIGA